MRFLGLLRAEPRRVAILAVCGLLVALTIVGLAGLVSNQRVGKTTEEALRKDIELEHRADELRVAVLELRYRQRDLATSGSSRRGIEEFERAYEELLGRIGRLEDLGVRDQEMPEPGQLREMARGYYAEIRPAIDDPGPGAFAGANDRGLARLAGIESVVREVQVLGEERSEAALSRIRATNDVAWMILLVLLGGLLLIGSGLAYVAARMARKLAEGEERFRLLAENTRDLIYRYRFTPTRGFEYVSPSATAITGYTPEEHYEDPDLGVKLVHPEDRRLLEGSALFSETPLTLRWFRKDGGMIWTEQLNEPVYDAAGELVGLEGIARNVTARKQAEEDLRESEERLRLALEAASLGIWYQDLATGEFVASQQADAMHGLPPGTPLDPEKALAVVHPEDRAEVAARVGRAIATDGAYEAEYRIVRPEGTVRWMASRARVYDRDGGGKRLIGIVQDITGRKQAEEQIHFQAHLLDQVQAAVIVTDLEGVVTHWNAHAEKLYGFSREEVLGRDITRLTVGPAEADIADEIMERLRNGEVWEGEFTVRRQDGSTFPAYVIDSLIHDPRGRAVGVVGVSTDITERKKAEQALRDSEERYRLLFEGNPHPTWVYDLETLAFLAVNESAVHHYGYSREEFLSMTIEDIRPPEDVPALLDRTFAPVQGIEKAGVWRHRKKDGTVIEVEITTRTFVFGGRHAKLVLAHDVTGRRRAEEALRFQKALLESQSEASIDGILVVSDGGEILSSNRRFALMWDVPGEVIAGPSGDTVLSFVSEKLVDAAGFLERVAYLHEHPEEESREEILLDDERTFDCYSAPVRDAEGPYYGRVWYFRDVTERKRVEDELARSLRSKNDLLADVSHELRTPLTTIRTNAEVALEIERGCAHTGLLEEIAKGSTRMSRLVEDLLFLARSDSATPPLDLEAVAIPGFLNEVAGRAETLARGRGAAFEARLSGEGRLELDPGRVEQAILILVDNAARYGPPGGLVKLTSATVSGGLRIEVEDRGPGIPEGDLPHVFERFYRGTETRTKDGWQGGAGLGLAIAKTIAEAHGGRIEVASQPGKGTRMSLYLPLVSAAHPAERERPKPVAPG